MIETLTSRPPAKLPERRRNRISLCMIVKDEERFLGQCLDSALGVVDEIVVVDTGSSDQSVAIAESYNAKVVHFAWTGHFAEARNQAIAAAGGDFILTLDADEQLDASTAYRIREAVDRGDFDVAYLQFANMGEEGPTGRRWIAPRLYRMTPGIRYVGRVHEQVAQELPKVRSCTVDAVVYHYGYQQSVFLERDKTERNARLLEQALEDPEAKNPLLRSNYLYHYAQLAKGEELLERFESFVEYVRQEWPGGPPRAPWITAGMAECARLLHDAGRYKKAARLAGELLERSGPSPLLEFVAARGLAVKGDIEQAEEILRRVIEPQPQIAPEHQQYSIDVPLVQGRAHFLLGLIEESRGREAEAVDHFQAAYNEEPEQEVFWSALLCLLTRLGRHSDALALLEKTNAASTGQPSLDCLGLALSVLTRSPGRLVFWGEKVRHAAGLFGGAQRMLQQLERLGANRNYRLEDFPEIHQAVMAPADPATFRMPQTIRQSETIPQERAVEPKSDGTPAARSVTKK